MARVLILAGSDSDLEALAGATKVLRALGVPYELHIASAHRTPDRAADLARTARDAGFGAIIAAAGMSAHLAGAIAARTTIPVIGVPMASGSLLGIDALLSTVNMPPGIPVATVGIGSAGAQNAGILAAEILALGDAELRTRLDACRQDLARGVEEKDRARGERFDG
ncbi:MAG: 5-(carboxyamino)imidazole ribonucleotide mutase [Planctomycetes bacterium]|nr:5-(carboxyamino)imidazole ribonucleotide mutase [Planctomycetota bacterium]